MKKTKILIPAMSVLALGMAAAVTGTVAWFSANNVVTATGMTFKSVTPSSLAIGKQLTSTGIGQATAIDYTLDENGDPIENLTTAALNPTSHWHATEENPLGVEDTEGGFYTVTNGEFIDPITGLAAAEVTNSNPAAGSPYQGFEKINFGALPEGLESNYYLDYTCYIASVGEGIDIGTGGYLRATPSITTTGTNDTIHAATIDFVVYKLAYYNDDTHAVVNGASSAFVQGVNQIGIDYRVNRHATYQGQVAAVGNTAKTYADVLTQNDNIPTASSNYAVKIVMRFYFDGALLKDSNNAYVATNRLDTHDVNVTVTFSLNRGN